ncbi:hypothetical protein [Micromonospora echinaurantiaca]|uniref:hypothetical protein n=1 Tax=Micromonospora echinaurantiaca TaxID=47857 RepID=UPI003792DECD
MDEIRAWLTALPVDAANEVITLWPSDRFAAKLRFGQFVAHLDDLWWPSRDDVIVVDQRGAMPKVLVIDHEERLTFGVLDDSWPR